jgi:hypothetical protein
MKRYRFVTDCIHSAGPDIREMVEAGESVTRATFVRHTDDQDRRWLEKAMGYDVVPITKDWHVGYFKGHYRGVPAYWMTWSAIEHIFTLDGEVGPSLEEE